MTPDLTRAEIEAIVSSEMHRFEQQGATSRLKTCQAINQLLRQLDAANALLTGPLSHAAIVAQKDREIIAAGARADGLRIALEDMHTLATNHAARADAAEAQIVWVNYDDEYPTYHQGKDGEHEVNEPVTAKAVTHLINTIKNDAAKILPDTKLPLKEYFHPEDVIVSEKDGVRTARLAYTTHFGADLVVFQSEKPVLFEVSDVEAFKAHWHRIWIKAREAARTFKPDATFLQEHPSIFAPKASWHDFIAAGNEPTIPAWLKWSRPLDSTEG